MTREEAKKIIFSQWQSFLENYIDYAGISEAYKMAIKALEQQPCEDAISRARVVEWLHNCTDDSIEHAIDSNIEFIPSVTPKQKMGRWIWQTEDIYRCSECGENIHVKEVMNVPQYEFCPICGAKMAESEE